MQRSTRNAMRNKWRLSCCIRSCIWLHNSLHNPCAHGRDVRNCLWQVQVIVENDLDVERWGSRANYIKNYCTDLYAVNSQRKVLEPDQPTSFITEIRCPVVDQILKGSEGFGCKSLYIETIYWLPMTTTCIFTFNCWASTDCEYDIKLSVNGASTIFGLTFSANKGLQSHIFPK